MNDTPEITARAQRIIAAEYAKTDVRDEVIRSLAMQLARAKFAIEYMAKKEEH